MANIKNSTINTPEPPQKKYPAGLVLEKGSNRKLGIALVGLGKYCTTQLMPAIEQSAYYKVVALVTGTEEKAKKYSSRYNLTESSIYNYENFDSIKDNPEIDIVYIVLPNSMHAEFSIRSARAGKHVICEKPMAMTSGDCEKMIKVCEENKKGLFIGYRLHFEPHNLEAMKFGTQKPMGNVKKIEASFGFEIEPDVWRLKKNLAGGGSLIDVGIYVIQAAQYVLGMNPIAIRNAIIKKSNDPKFQQVEGDINWEMEFSNGVVAYCYSSYTSETDRLFIEAEKGWLELNPAFYYQDLAGRTSKGELNIKNINQQKAQLDGIADSLLNGSENLIPGKMGLLDLKIIETIYKSASKNGERIPLNLDSIKIEI